MPSSSGVGAVPSSIAKRWVWFVALGAVLVLLGVIAWSDVAAVTLASTIIVGASLIVGGVFQILQCLMVREWRGFIFGLLSGALYLVGGLLIINEPVQGAVVLTILLAATVVVGGVARIVIAFGHRDVRAWGLVIFSGLVSIVVGCLLYASLPWSGLWVLGTLVAIELLIQGAGWLYFGIALRFAVPHAQ